MVHFLHRHRTLFGSQADASAALVKNLIFYDACWPNTQAVRRTGVLNHLLSGCHPGLAMPAEPNNAPPTNRHPLAPRCRSTSNTFRCRSGSFFIPIIAPTISGITIVKHPLIFTPFCRKRMHGSGRCGELKPVPLGRHRGHEMGATFDFGTAALCACFSRRLRLLPASSAGQLFAAVFR